MPRTSCRSGSIRAWCCHARPWPPRQRRKTLLSRSRPMPASRSDSSGVSVAWRLGSRPPRLASQRRSPHRGESPTAERLVQRQHHDRSHADGHTWKVVPRVVRNHDERPQSVWRLPMLVEPFYVPPDIQIHECVTNASGNGEDILCSTYSLMEVNRSRRCL